MLPLEAGSLSGCSEIAENLDPKYLTFRKHKGRGFPWQHSYVITLSFLTVSAHYSSPAALRGKQGAAKQDRALASTRKSCRKPIMEKPLSISDPLLLNGLFLQQALSPSCGRKHLFMSHSHFTWLRDRFENSGWIITFWFLSIRKLILIKGSNCF